MPVPTILSSLTSIHSAVVYSIVPDNTSTTNTNTAGSECTENPAQTYPTPQDIAVLEVCTSFPRNCTTTAYNTAFQSATFFETTSSQVQKVHNACNRLLQYCTKQSVHYTYLVIGLRFFLHVTFRQNNIDIGRSKQVEI